MWKSLREREYHVYHEVPRSLIASCSTIDKLKLVRELEGHQGCVNSVLFSDNGDHIFTGSDDTSVNIYSLEDLSILQSLRTIHTNNIFFARDLPYSNGNDIITCSADGRVVHMDVPSECSTILFRHTGRAHRIALVPRSPCLLFSCGEDGKCCHFDLRCESSDLNPILQTRFLNLRKRCSSIFSIQVNPVNPQEIIIAGSAPHVSLYDIRKFNFPIKYFSPNSLRQSHSAQITGIKFNFDGTSLIASYSANKIYRFDSMYDGFDSYNETLNNDGPDSCSLGYQQCYEGHLNEDTVKQVSFYGLRSEYVISGSDCGHVIFWDTETGSPIRAMKADSYGAVNCLASHPRFPFLATSGLDDTAKFWSPDLDISNNQEARELGLSSYHDVVNRNRSFQGDSSGLYRICRIFGFTPEELGLIDSSDGIRELLSTWFARGLNEHSDVEFEDPDDEGEDSEDDEDDEDEDEDDEDDEDEDHDDDDEDDNEQEGDEEVDIEIEEEEYIDDDIDYVDDDYDIDGEDDFQGQRIDNEDEAERIAKEENDADCEYSDEDQENKRILRSDIDLQQEICKEMEEESSYLGDLDIIGHYEQDWGYGVINDLGGIPMSNSDDECSDEEVIRQ